MKDNAASLADLIHHLCGDVIYRANCMSRASKSPVPFRDRKGVQKITQFIQKFTDGRKPPSPLVVRAKRASSSSSATTGLRHSPSRDDALMSPYRIAFCTASLDTSDDSSCSVLSLDDTDALRHDVLTMCNADTDSASFQSTAAAVDTEYRRDSWSLGSSSPRSGSVSASPAKTAASPAKTTALTHESTRHQHTTVCDVIVH